MRRAYYSSSISDFLNNSANAIIGELTRAHARNLDQTQLNAWLEQINILKLVLVNRTGRIYFEYAIPRMGKRIDVVLLIGPVIFVLEFKVGESHFTSSALDQVTDYCLDLKNFHESSYHCVIAPILIATTSRHVTRIVCTTPKNDKLLAPMRSTVPYLSQTIDEVLAFASDEPNIDPDAWERGRYCPTPTIIEAARTLYNKHSVEDITRHEAGLTDITRTSESIDEIINASREGNFKSICFVTGVPGAGKTLVGLDVANRHRDPKSGTHTTFLSGNGPLVAILREALSRDHVANEKAQNRKVTKTEARRQVSSFIQNVHHFRDEYLRDEGAPSDHIVLFDEAQRAWNLQQTSSFMLRKKNVANFNVSEPEFLISCMDRHPDWAVIVCLVGGGQEINTGEAGISEWIEALNRSFPNWHIFISSQLADTEYGAGKVLEDLAAHSQVTINQNLHLAVSMRSFRAENVSQLVKQILDLDPEGARQTLAELNDRYPIVITRDLAKAKQWLRHQARGTERYGIVVSSQAERLKPHAIDVKTPVNPVDWFLSDKADVRSSYYLEDVATEFSVQGLELDWVCVTWDADFRHSNRGWEHWKFQGSRWMHINLPHRQLYLKNAYRVLLTRARQGMVIVVPAGDSIDPTRHPDFYDRTFEYLQRVGFKST
jgi:Schlafen group 3, DNA/RNA helicase domain